MFWTTTSFQLCCAPECLGSACASTGQQSPSCPFLPGCSTTALQQLRVWAFMCWQLAGQAVITRKVPGKGQRVTPPGTGIVPRMAIRRSRLLVLACIWPCAYFLQFFLKCLFFLASQTHSSTNRWPQAWAAELLELSVEVCFALWPLMTSTENVTFQIKVSFT